MSIKWAAKLPDNSTDRHYNFEKPSGGSASQGRGIRAICQTGREPIRNAEFGTVTDPRGSAGRMQAVPSGTVVYVPAIRKPVPSQC